MSEWVNYGDTNFVEYGGILLKATDRADCFEFIDVSETENGLMQTITGTVYTTDFLDKKEEICTTVGYDLNSVDNDSMGFACAIIEHFGGFQLDGRPINNPLEGEYNITKYELYKQLNEIGFSCDYELSDAFKGLDNFKLADYIDDFLYDIGEYEHEEESRLSFIDSESRANTVDNIKGLLDKNGKKFGKEFLDYFETKTRELNKSEDELFEKAEIFVDVLKDYISKEKTKNEIERD